MRGRSSIGSSRLAGRPGVQRRSPDVRLRLDEKDWHRHRGGPGGRPGPGAARACAVCPRAPPSATRWRRSAQLRTHPPGRTSRLQPGDAARWPGRACACRPRARRTSRSSKRIRVGRCCRPAFFLGNVAFKDISVTNGRVFVHRRADGTSNLPQSRRQPRQRPAGRCVSIASDVPRLAIDVRDEQADLALHVPAIGFVLTPDEGSIALAQPADLRFGSRTTRISQVERGRRVRRPRPASRRQRTCARMTRR